MNDYELKMIEVGNVEVGDRFRKEMGDIGELIESFKKHGVIAPLAVTTQPCQSPSDKPYRLLAGGRRFIAAMKAGLDIIPVKVYTEQLTELQMRSIELEENIRRKNLSYMEECYLTREIDRLQTQIYGKKISTSPDASGHSMRDTATLLGKSPASVSTEIKLANTMDSFPEFNWDKCKDKAEALRIVARLEEGIVRADLSERAASELGGSTKKLMDSYIVGDFFDGVKGLPDKCMDLVEIDPPYAIDLPGLKNGHGINYGDSYNEIPENSYIEFLIKTLAEAYRVMKDDSWLIFWFGPEPWFDIVHHLIVDAGFKNRRIPGIWAKPTGQTKQYTMYLANSYEMFFYARKGNAEINIDKQGRSNIFQFSPVTPSEKIHPTERPIEMMEELLKIFTWEGSRVLVPFAGSGNTLRASFNLNMFPLGYDLSKEYKDAFVSRILKEELSK